MSRIYIAEVINNRLVIIEGHNVTAPIEFKVSETNGIVIKIGSNKYKITEDDLLRLKVLFDIVKKEAPRALVNTSNPKR